MKKLLVSLSLLITFASFIVIPDFLPRKATVATLCAANGSPEQIEQFASSFNLALRIALWCVVSQTLIVIGLAYATRNKRKPGEKVAD
ncbi:MAG: hypothetical protein EG825_09440 [Rhodocyclaceae bacterium]|nr:hypothetical protein [Rhodocyclaceae bacterium]